MHLSNNLFNRSHNIQDTLVSVSRKMAAQESSYDRYSAASSGVTSSGFVLDGR
jgi:hypothetical protein